MISLCLSVFLARALQNDSSIAAAFRFPSRDAHSPLAGAVFIG